ncbi:MAG: F0F1 ATP synthase subunit B [Hyphomicrobiaceae bacterium]|nr:MAG: F0F1 ATP synthase subunit B [Hyphomicrobiaceae bacterium]
MAQKVTAGTAVPDQPGHAKVFPPLDPGTFAPQLIWLALTFGLLYLILSRVALPRVGEVIEERSDRIKRDLGQAEKLKEETEQALAAYEQALAEARGKANAIAKSMRDNLTAEVDKERAKVEALIAQKLTEAEARIAQTKSKALASVNDIATDIAGAIVTKLTGAEVSKEEVQKALIRRAAE